MRYFLLYSLSAWFALFVLAPFTAAQNSADEQTAQPAETEPIAIEQSTTTYEYRIEDRPDPFAPFVTPTAQTNPLTPPDEIIDNDQVLTGMQLFEPGQLTLVALMLTEGAPYAMVQDSTGRGYVIEEGMKIGRRGVITRITEDRVLIEETAQTRSGRTLKNEIAMVLKREGEE